MKQTVDEGITRVRTEMDILEARFNAGEFVKTPSNYFFVLNKLKADLMDLYMVQGEVDR
jgi:hypothetical protein